MRTIIAGSRKITYYKIVLNAIRKSIEISGIRPTCVISGGANGIDKLGEKFAKEFEFPLEIHNAEWDKYGNKAGFVRNEQMALVSDALIAIWDGESKGTMHMINLAKKYGLKTYVYNIKEHKGEYDKISL